ncbi:hypothetical protein FRC07_001725, partial [Ceratobasidium sp. 392]
MPGQISLPDVPIEMNEHTLSVNAVGHHLSIEYPRGMTMNSPPDIAAPTEETDNRLSEGASEDAEDAADASGLLVADQSGLTAENEDNNLEELLNLSPRAPQYIVEDDVESIDSNRVSYRTPKAFDMPTYEVICVKSDKTSSIVNWDKQVREAENAPQYIYDEDIENWRNPFASAFAQLPEGSDHISVCSEDSNTGNVPIEINAFICQVPDDYVNNDEQYEEVLWQLRRASEEAASAISDHQAGPSTGLSRPCRRNPRVTVEEEPEPSQQGYKSSTTEMSTQKGKGKRKPKNKSSKKKTSSPKAKRPNLGLNIEELQTTEKKTPKRKKRESGAYQARRAENTPQGFNVGGYLEYAHGRNQGPASNNAESENRSDTRPPPSSGRRSRTTESGAGG